MKSATATRILIASVIFFFFGAFILRSAMRLAATALHSIFFMAVLLGLTVWILYKPRQ